MSDRFLTGEADFRPSSLAVPSVMEPRRPTGIIGPALSAGWNELQGTTGAAVQAFGTMIGSPTIANYGREVALRNMAEAQAAGRPDLETAPWREGGGGLAGAPAWLAYQAVKQGPQIAATTLAALAAARFGGRLPMPAAVAEAGAAAPTWMGGGGLRAGMTAAEQAAARATGAEFARGVGGATVAGYPIGVGSIMQEANERAAAGGAAPSRSDAAWALAGGVPYAALEALHPAQIASFVGRGAQGNLLPRIGRGIAGGAAVEAPVEAVQTAMELALRPDMSLAQKANQIVDAALTGGAVGGVFGGAASLRRARNAPPEELAQSPEALTRTVDEGLNRSQPALPAPPPRLALPAPPPLPVPTGPLAQEDHNALLQAQQALSAGHRAEGMTEQDRVSLLGAINEELIRRRAPNEMPDEQLQTFLAAASAAERAGKLSDAERERIQAARWEALAREFPGQPMTANLVQAVRGAERAPKRKAALSPVEETADVMRRLQNPKQSGMPSTLQRAIAAGVYDQDGNERNLAAELDAAKSDRATAQMLVPLRGDEPVRQADARIAQLEETIARVRDAEALNAQRQKDADEADKAAAAKKGAPLTKQDRALLAKMQQYDEQQAALQAQLEEQGAAQTALVQSAAAAGKVLGQRPAGGPASPVISGVQVAPEAAAKLTDQGTAPQSLLLPRVPAWAADRVASEHDVGPTSPAIAAPPVMTRPAGPVSPVIGEAPPLWQMGAMSSVPQQPPAEQAGLDLGLPRNRAEQLQRVIDNPKMNAQVRRQATDALAALTENAPDAAARADRALLRAQQAPPRSKNARSAQTGRPAAQPEAAAAPGVTAAPATAPPTEQPSVPPAGTGQRPATTAVGTTSPPTSTGTQVTAPQAEQAKPIAQERKREVKETTSAPEVKGTLKATLKQTEARERKRAEKQVEGDAPTGRQTRAARSAQDVNKLAKGATAEADRAEGERQGSEPRLTASQERRLEEVYAASEQYAGAITDPGPDRHDAGLEERRVRREETNAARGEGLRVAERRGLTGNDARRFSFWFGAGVVDERSYVGYLMKEQGHPETDPRVQGAKAADAWRAAHPSETFGAKFAQAMQRDRERADATPQGPFTDAKTNVVKTDGVEQRFADVLHGWMTQLGMDKIRVLLATKADINTSPVKYKLFGKYSLDKMEDDDSEGGSKTSFGPGHRDFVITLNPENSVEEQLEVLGHELGHIVMDTLFANADEKTQAAVLAEFNDFLAAAKGIGPADIRMAVQSVLGKHLGPKTVAAVEQDIIREVSEIMHNSRPEFRQGDIRSLVARTLPGRVGAAARTNIANELAAWARDVRGLSQQEVVRMLRPRVMGERAAQQASATRQFSENEARYWMSFREWFADQVAKYSTTDAKPVGVVAQFFKKVAQALKRLLSVLTPSHRPTPAMEKFLREMGPTTGLQGAFLASRGAAPIRESALSGPTNPSTRLSPAVTQASDLAGKATQMANKWWDKAVDGKVNIRSFLRAGGLAMSTVNTIERLFGDVFPQIKQYREAMQRKSAIHERGARLFDSAHDQAYRVLAKVSLKAAELVRKLMRYTEFAIDPRKTWEQHKHLHTHENEVNLRRLVAEANADMRQLNQMLGSLKSAGKIKTTDVFDQLVATNEAMHFALMSTSLGALVKGDAQASAQLSKLFGDAPMTEFIDNAKYSESTYAARDYWKGVLTKQMAAVEKYVGDTGKQIEKEKADAIAAGKVDRHGAPKQSAITTRSAAALSARLQNIKGGFINMANAPNFHLGRYGEYFVSFDFRRLPGQEGSKRKRPDPAAIREITKQLEAAGFTDFVLSEETERDRAFIRVDTEAKRQRLVQAVQKMEKEKLLSDVKSGDRAQADAPVTMKSEWLDEFLTHLESTGKLTPDLRSHIRDVYVDMLPDTAFNKIMLHRENIPGYGENMMHSFAQRMNASITSLSNMATIGDVADAFVGMHAKLDDLKSTDLQNAQRYGQVVNEMVLREKQRPTRPDTTWIDRVRSFNHAYFLGASPAYVIVNITQLGSMLLPELGRKHGFRESAAAMGRAGTLARKVTWQMIQEGFALGRGSDAVITDNVLRKAGLSAEMIGFVTRAMNRSNIDVGGASRELGRTADPTRDNKLDKAIRYAGAMGFYAETFTRLTAALAARELMLKKNPQATQAQIDDYVDEVVTESMLNYQSWNTGRSFGKHGFAGPMTPLVTAFMQYSFQVIEKLYRDVNTAFINRAATAEEKREARRFIGAHMAAVTVLAGSLGLPAAALFARAIEAMKDLVDGDDEPTDLRASWRNFLADIFGQDVGEVLARGLPRAFGVDMSQRAGEQDIIPFSRFLTDRRKLEDRVDDLYGHALGSPGSMATNLLLGFRDIVDGNVVRGMQRMLPVGIRAPFSAYQMTEHGYRDNQGRELPMSVEAQDVLIQALGFKPAERAEYDEARQAQQVRRGVITQEASNLRQGIVRAMEQGDRESAANWMAQARRFDRNNPAYAVMPTLGSALAERAVSSETARSLGLPIGTNIRDQRTRGLTSFANY